MPLIDKEGRLLTRFNLFDLFVAAVVVVVAVLAYQRLSAPHRLAPPYALERAQTTVLADLQLPAEQAWMCGVVAAGQVERDPRTGAAQVTVLGCTTEDDLAVVSLRMDAVQDDAGRILFEGAPLVPGRTLELNTEAAVLSGVVRRVTRAHP